MSAPRRLRGLVLAGLALALVGGCGGQQQDVEQAVRSIAWARAEATNARVLRVLPGRIEAPEAAGVGFDVAGRIEALAVDIGDRFDRGDVLATIDAREYRNLVDTRRADLEEARARLDQARSDHARQEKLHADGVVAEAALERAEEALATARARVSAARARLQTAREDLEETRLRAPYAGAVTARHAEAGERVAPGAPVLEVQRGGGLTVRVNIPETLIRAVAPGETHRVALPGRDLEPLAATVLRIGAGGDRRGLFPVDLALEGSRDAVRPGMTATVRMRLPLGRAHEDLVAIPATAYAAGPGPGEEIYTFVFDEDSSRVERRVIDIARVADRRALVAGGLEPGEIVAARGIAFLEDGEEVRRLGVGIRRFDSEPDAL